MRLGILVLWCTASLVYGQQFGTVKENLNLPLQLEECTGAEDCKAVKTKVTLDANWRWLHDVDGYENCYTGNEFDESFCSDPESCTENCALEGVDAADWETPYGVHSDGTELKLDFVTVGEYSTNIGSRVFLLDSSEETYHMFYLKNREFTMDVDVSNLPCGINGAVYFVEMDEDAGMSKYPTNEAGPAFGTGYCDAQCPHDLKFITGEANILEWTPSEVDINSGKGYYGSCCVELDIWEANSVASAFTLHPCNTVGNVRCEGVDCGDNASDERYKGICDKDGCDFHHWRLGDQKYFGPGEDFQVNTDKPMTVVTQFITHDGTDTGDLVEMRRIYLQDGKIIENSLTNIDGVDATDSINEKMCDQVKEAFGDEPDFQRKGGMNAFSKSMENGMVLVLSLWDDFEAHMLWLDSDYPLDKDPSEPGVNRGPCSTDSGNPPDLQEEVPHAFVKFSNLRVGTLGSTYPGGNSGETTTTTESSNANCPGSNLEHCLSLCPETPQQIHDGCVQECKSLCL